MQLTVTNLGKSFGTHEIFQDVSFTVAKGEHIGLVGVNGSGKTTLLKCLLNPDYADTGMVSFEAGLQAGYVEQGFDRFGPEPVWEFMFQANQEILQLRRKLADLEQAVAAGDEEALAAYARATQRYEYLDGYHYETNLKKVLFGLAFPESMWQQPAASLSGGQKTRLMLAAALVSSPDFFILDEPTNHLDIVMMEWLEQYLREFRGGLLVVSHDRAFLDNVATRILEMEDGRLRSFSGNYSRYLAQKEIQVKTEQAAYEAQQDLIAAEEAYIRRFKAGIKSKMARGRQSRLDRLERLEKPVENETFTLRLPKAPECADRVLILDHLSAGYEGRVLIDKADLILRRGQKVGLLGPNGSGKTTLLRTILGEVKALGGEAKIGNRVQIGYFSQSYERLDPEQTLFDNFLTEYGLTDEQTRSLLGGMMFHGDDVYKKIGTLSGGQKARLVLLKLVMDGANFLILDEPTNHLDILAQETVEAALELFDGTVLVVSHDRYFINEIVDRIWEIEDGTLQDYQGNYEYYVTEKARRRQQTDAERAEEARRGAEQAAKERQTEAEAKARKALEWAEGAARREEAEAEAKKKKRRLTPSELQKRLDEVEMRIREQDAMLSYLDQQISVPENQMDLALSQSLATEREETAAKLDRYMQQWEELLEQQDEQEEDTAPEA